MKKTQGDKKFMAACSRIFNFFDSLPDDAGTGNHPYHNEYIKFGDFPIGSFLDFYLILNSVHIDGGIQDKIGDKLSEFLEVSFCLGFIIGRELDITIRDPAWKKDIETVKQTIRKKGLLPYFPREKRA